ncbi:MAG: hypothetical protein IKK01_07370 [Clostridia bacterium]|nr:hypothetical protein [Clostridia bacterium]
MKKILFALLAMLLVLCLPLVVSASGNNYTIDNITVEFSDTSTFSTEQQEVIAQAIINGTDNSYTTYNLLCTLFGHKETTESIGAIEHCVSATAPRCTRTIYEITACTRCETVIDTITISKVYIFCCD